MSRVGGVDDFIDFQMGGHVDGLPMFVHSIHHLLVKGLAFFGIGFRFELFSVTQLDCALKPHAAELSGGPRHRKKRSFEAPAGHGLSAEAVALSQDQGEEWDGQVGAHHEKS